MQKCVGDWNNEDFCDYCLEIANQIKLADVATHIDDLKRSGVNGPFLCLDPSSLEALPKILLSLPGAWISAICRNLKVLLRDQFGTSIELAFTVFTNFRYQFLLEKARNGISNRQ